MKRKKHFQSVSRLFFNQQRTQKVPLLNRFQSVSKNDRFQRKAGNWKRKDNVSKFGNGLINEYLNDFYMSSVAFPERNFGNALETVN